MKIYTIRFINQLTIVLLKLLIMVFVFSSCQGDFDSKIIDKVKSGSTADDEGGGGSAPAANAIKGVTGVSDGVVDQWLTGSVVPTIAWDAFTGAASYDVMVKDAAGTVTICPLANTTNLSFSFSGCALTDGATYKVYVSGKSASGNTVVDATNNGYTFSVDASALGPFMITGITGGSDNTIDGFLVDPVTTILSPTVRWSASPSADVYDIIIKDAADAVTLCTANNVVGTSHAFVGCILTDGFIYRVHVTAKRNSGSSSLLALNDAFFTFRIDNMFPAAFTVSGVTGGTDVVVDTWLSGGTSDPTVTWNASVGGATYDVVIKDNANVVVMCTLFGVVGTSGSPAGCALVSGQSYRVHLTAKSGSGINATAATNSSIFSFTVDSVVPGSFTISGVTGGSDVIQDAWLVNNLNPTVHFGAATDAASYDITIRNNADTVTMCQLLGQAGSPVSLAGCGLVNNTSYRVFVSAKNGSGLTTTPATNDNFVFTVDTTTPTTNTISGIRGASDAVSDAWLVLGVNPRVYWTAFANAASYDVVIRDAAGAVVVCTLENTASTNHDFSSCNLSDGVSYKAYVTGKSPSGLNTVAASNNPFNFTVDSQSLGAFNITGVTGGADVTVDSWLTAATNPVVNFDVATGAATYDVLIKNALGTVTLCQNLGAVAPPVTLAGCGLVNTGTYRIYITAKTLSGLTTLVAANDATTFTVDSTTPGAFNITGITGVTDVTVDAILAAGDLDPKINWGASASAATYDVTVTNAADTVTLCSQTGVAASPVTLAGCGLANGTTYRAHITAKSVSGLLSTLATNDATFTFQVDTVIPQAFTITGVTAGADVTADQWLNIGTDPTITWVASTNASTYTVLIKNSADTVTLCTQAGVVGTSVAMTGCGLVNLANYRIHVSALSPTGGNQLAATNNSFVFTVDSLPPTAFAITGVTGSGDNVVDTWLAGGALDPIINFQTSTNAATYSIEVRDTTDTTVLCSRTGVVSSPATMSSCGLTNGLNLRVRMTAHSASGVYTTNATNFNTYNFDVDTSIPGAFNISGVTGGSDVSADMWLIDGVDPTIYWTASAGAMDYDVIIKNNADTVTICSFMGVSGPSLATTGCGLVNSTVYKVHVYANPFSGPLETEATNSPFNMQIDNTPPGVFNITGITGGTDVTADTWLNNGFNPTVNWGASALATSYDLEIKDTTDAVSQCTAISATTSGSPIGCALSNLTNYRVHVTAKSPSGFHSRIATNDNTFNFDVDSGTLGAFTVSGVRGASDAITDTWLVGSLNPEIHWSASAGSTTYDIDIRNQADTVSLCTSTGNVASPVTVMGCGLVNGNIYRAKLTARSVSGLNTLAASNNATFQFTVDTTVPGAFNITGVTGGSDAIVDTWLHNGVNPTVVFTAAAGAASYVVTVRDPTDSFTQCTVTVVGSPAGLTGCGLASGLNFLVKVTARSPSTYTTNDAGNSGVFTFQLDNTTPGAFTIQGIRGGGDVINDAWLVGGLTPSIAFTASGNAATYDLAIYDSTNVVQVCSLNGATASPAVVTGCTLTNNVVYRARVKARSTSGILENDATNNAFSFTVDNNTPAAFNITGITGQSLSGDGTVDAYLATTGSVNPVVNWQAAAGAANYTIAIREMDNTLKCQVAGITITNHDFGTACALVNGVDYRVEVRAFSASGLTFTDATNTNTFTFLVDGSTPDPFTYRGITASGGGDSIQDMFLSAGLNPRVNYDNLTTFGGAFFVDIVIRDLSSVIKCQIIDKPTATNGHNFTGGECGLIVGQTYTVSVVAKSQSKLKTTSMTVPSSGAVTSANFTVDNSAPTLTYNITPSYSPNSSSQQIITGTCADIGSGIPAGGVKLCIKDSSNGTCSFPADYVLTTNCTSGNYSYTANMTTELWQIQVAATDAAGNTGVIVGQGAQNYQIYSSINDWTSTTIGPSTRSFHSSVWTGSQMLVWGGSNAGVPVNTGGRYIFSTDSWGNLTTAGAPTARSKHSAVWSGTEMLIFGGINAGGTSENTGGRYHLGDLAWTNAMDSGSAPSARANHTAVWTGSKMIVWGGDDLGTATNTGSVYDPAGNTWTATTTVGAPSARTNHTAVWTGTYMIIFGGESSGTPQAGGAMYDPALDSWSALPALNMPSDRYNHAAFYSGGYMYIWGGTNGAALSDGARYAIGGAWSALGTGGSPPSARHGHVMAVTNDNTRMIIWGGDAGGLTNTGAIYNIGGGTWSATNTVSPNTPSARHRMKAVWAPEMFRFIIWGGYDGSADVNTGGNYAP